MQPAGGMSHPIFLGLGSSCFAIDLGEGRDRRQSLPSRNSTKFCRGPGGPLWSPQQPASEQG